MVRRSAFSRKRPARRSSPCSFLTSLSLSLLSQSILQTQKSHRARSRDEVRAPAVFTVDLAHSAADKSSLRKSQGASLRDYLVQRRSNIQTLS
jgi:hypothetical protein